MASKDKNSKASVTPKKTTAANVKAAPKKAKTTTTKSTVKSKVATAKNKTTTNQVASKIEALNLTNKHLISNTNGADMEASFLNITDKNQMPFTINKCYDFNKEIFDIIFNDVDTTGIRIYFGVNSQNEMCLVFTGIDSNFNDVYLPLDKTLQASLNDTHAVCDMGEVCAPSPTYGKDIIQLP